MTRSAIPAPIRLILVDDHVVLRAGLANVLSFEPGMKVVLLLDLCMPGIDGVETLQRLRQEFPAARVLILTSSEAPEEVRHAMAAGACGFVTKTIHPAELMAAIRQVHAGGQVIGQAVAAHLAVEQQGGSISRRELETLGFVRQGFTNAEIGRLMGVSENTAKAHVKALLVKLQAADRAEAVARGFERGLLKA
jgi:DNA-binding NarL/FixJ family response regulator